jgi:alkenylglycerophosphocholine hydrolase
VFNGLLLLTGVAFVAEWYAVAKGNINLRRVTKPAAMLALLAWFTHQGAWQGELWWFGMGLVFSLAGDIFLLLPVFLFPAGALSFLAAHVFYIIGLNQRLPAITWLSLLPLAAAAITAFFFARNFFHSLKHRQSKRLKALILVYMIGISCMLLSALLSPLRPGWPPAAAAWTIAGAGLFFTSDSILAWNKFIRPLKYGNLMVMVTYLLGQLGIVTGALLMHGRM